MYKKPAAESRFRALVVIFALLLLTSMAIAPAFLSTEAKPRKGKGLNERTKSHDESLPNFDIRTDKFSYKLLASLRERTGKSASSVADFRDSFVEGEENLKRRVDRAEVVYGPHSRTPEVIGIDVTKGKQVLAAAAGSRAETVKRFIGENSSLFGLRSDQATGLKVLADYKNPEGEMSFVRLEQRINGVKVFAGEVRAGFNKKGDLVRVVNNLAAGADHGAPDTFGDPATAYEIATNSLGSASELGRLESARFSKDGRYKFGAGDFAPVAEKVYFPTEPGVVVPAWLVLIWQPVNAFYLVVDVESGSVLWRKNISEDQTQPATYNIWGNPNAMINVADSPFPRTPGPNSPDGTQAPALARTLVTLVGNEAPYTFNNNGWITDGGNMTDGNAVEAGLDRDGAGNQPSNGVDANGIAVGTPNRVFDWPINPGVPVPSGAPAAGDSPLPPGVNATPCVAAGTSPAMIDFQRAAVTQLFYITNRYHDELYRLGFTEEAGNFQHDNFGRGGIGGDRVSAEAQDCSGTNNANFGTPTDGQRGRMQMYIWVNNVPNFDGDLDADVVIHELTHGLSNRLHGNAFGLASNMPRGMGEGWSDFYAHALLSEPTDDPAGTYTTGAYDTYRHRADPNRFNNYYYGIRRFPKAIISSVGGPNNRPHNPLTFADIDATQANTADGAFPAVSTGSSIDAVHAAGEVWSSMLWEVRAKYIARLGWEVGNRRILQHVTDGMKLSPLNPTFVDARNAIVAAALAGGTSDDVSDIWSGFALRGLGASAQVTNTGAGGSGTTRVVQAFDLPNLQQPGVTVSDAQFGDNDGFAEPGERVRITIPLRNETGSLANDVFATLVGGGTLAYGSIAHNGMASNEFNYTIPFNAACGAVLDLTINVTSSLGPASFTRKIPVGIPQNTLVENFDGVSAPALPPGWTAASVSDGPNFVSSTLDPNSPPNSMYALEPSTVGGGTDLTSPSIAITASAATLSFRHKYNTEPGWDGGVVEISVGGGAFQDIVSAGGIFTENGYNGQLGVSNNSPLGGRNAWSGNSGGYVTTRIMLPQAAAGQNVQLRWRFGSDDNTVAPGANPGWFIDDVAVAGSYACSFTPSGDVRSDFDGDRRSDFALYRPSEGIWYVLPAHSNGYFGFRWGMSGDIPTPADFDNDGKTDAALFRPSEGVFYVLRSSDLTYSAARWGVQGDIPVVQDYDGDERPDYAVYRPSEQNWYVREADGGFIGVKFGQPGDVAVPGDFDGDGRGDMTVFRNGQWRTRFSSGGTGQVSWGLGSDMPVPADYDGDGRDDYSVFRPSEGTWWIIRSSGSGYAFHQWGLNGDIPVPGDYDGDGRYDPAVFRNGAWWAILSGGGLRSAQFGSPGDVPTGKKYIP
jgi:hypothetical protein